LWLPCRFAGPELGAAARPFGLDRLDHFVDSDWGKEAMNSPSRREQGLHNLIIMSYMCIVNVLLSFFLTKRVTVLIVNKWRSTADLQLSDTELL